MQIPESIIDAAVTCLKVQELPWPKFSGYHACDYSPKHNGRRLEFGGHYRDDCLQQIEIEAYDVETGKCIFKSKRPIQ